MLPTAGMIRAARGLLGWSQRDLAEYAGLHQNAVYRTEKNDTAIRPSTVGALARALEQGGVIFLLDTDDFIQGVALRKDFASPSDNGKGADR